MTFYSQLNQLWSQLEIFLWHTTAACMLLPVFFNLLLVWTVTTPALNAIPVGSKGFAMILAISLFPGASFEIATPD
jgi:hypothetical protein